MAETTTEEDAVINVKVPMALRRALDRACVARPAPGVGVYKLAEVVRIVLARAIEANMHLRLEEADAGEEAGA